MRILAVTHYFASLGGGIEIIADRLQKLLRNRGCDVRWMAAKTQALASRSVPEGPDCTPVPCWDGIRARTDLAFPLFAPRCLPVVWREVKAADVVHLHEAFYPLNQAALWSAVALKRPVVITQHIADMPLRGFFRSGAVSLANLVMTRPAIAAAHRVVFYSRRTERLFAPAVGDKGVFIPNGCDTQLFSPLEPLQRSQLRAQLFPAASGNVALFVGRFIEKKGLLLIRTLAQKHPKTTFVLIGRGSLDPSQWKLANVTIHPQQPHDILRQYYQAADLLLLPAVGEGLPLVVQEALCSGLPCVVSSEILEACPEMAPYVADAGPGGARLQPAFAQKLATPETQEQIQARSRFARTLWSWDRCADQYLQLFSSILRPTPS